MAQNYIVSGNDLTNLANAIRETAEVDEQLTWPDEYIEKVRGIGADQESAHDAADRAENAAAEASGSATDALASAGAASNSAAAASGSATQAEGYAEDAEAWAVGERNGTPVASGDETYQNNAKYWNTQASANAAIHYGESQTLTPVQKRTATHNVAVYDDLMGVIKITDATTTMGDITALLNAVNTAGDHVVFDVAGLNAGMYLCTIYIGAGFYRIADLVTGFEGTGFFAASDLLVNKIKGGATTTGKHYTVQWDKVNAQCTRLNDAASITTNTANFGHFGAVNENYDNPFDSIYPWSGRKLCNIDIDLYRGLTASDDITDCVVAWEDDVNFDYAHQYGVWVYTPPFFGRSYELGNYRYFDVTDENLQDNIAYHAMITGRWHGADVTLTIDGASLHCNLPVLGLSMADIALSTQHTYAKNWGASLTDIYTLDASTLLFIVEYATLNSQNAVGNGVSGLYVQGLHLSADVSNSNIVTIATNANIIPGAVFDIGTTNGNNNIAHTYVESVSGTTVTLHDAVTATTAHYVSIHGLINVADEAIGSKSGYIGTNGKCNAYYRGEVLWGNKYQYTLGCYRQQTTNHIWLADEDDTDNYDALNTSKHFDTGVALPSVETASWYWINGLAMADGLSVAPIISATGGNSTNPVGDQQYLPLASAGNTVLLSGGIAINDASDGALCASWNNGAGSSYWASGSRPRLKNPS